jgi:hypothetical protein
MIDFNSILQQGVTIRSSGTSGQAREYFQSPQKLKAANRVAIDAQELTSKSRIYTCCKITHAGGLLAQTLPALSIGATVDVVPFNAYDFVRTVKNYTHTHITPLHAKAIMMTKGFHTLDLTGLWVTCGADPVTWDIIDSFVSRGAVMMVNWGMSEIGPIAINRVFKNKEETNYLKINLATILGNRFYCEWKIENDELVVKSDTCIYDDWYYTKDKVFLDQEHLYYTGRTNKEIDLCLPKKG